MHILTNNCEHQNCFHKQDLTYIALNFQQGGHYYIVQHFFLFKISGHSTAFFDIDLQIDQLPEDDIEIDSSGYVTAKLRGQYYMSRSELHDLLNGAGWTLQGLTSYLEKVGHGPSKLKIHSIWVKEKPKTG